MQVDIQPASAFHPRDPLPGIYRDLPSETYHASPGLSRSRLAALVDGTPLDFRCAQSVEETPAMRLGTALHLAILEPDRFEALVRPLPKWDGRTKAGKEARAAWEEENAGKIGVATEDYERAKTAAAMVRRKSGPATALREGRAELSLYWHDGQDVLLKSRPDFLDLARGICVDVKSTSRGLSDAQVVRILHDHHAALQAAMASAAVLALTGANITHGMHLLVVSLADPIDMRLVEIGEDWLALGETQLAQALAVYRDCEASGRWPGWSDRGVTTVAMPSWIKSRSEREQNELLTSSLQ